MGPECALSRICVWALNGTGHALAQPQGTHWGILSQASSSSVIPRAVRMKWPLCSRQHRCSPKPGQGLPTSAHTSGPCGVGVLCFHTDCTCCQCHGTKMEDGAIAPWCEGGGTSPQARFSGRQCWLKWQHKGNKHQNQDHQSPRQQQLPALY